MSGRELFPPRGGWPFAGPPNCSFTLNRHSPQAQGLVGWWTPLMIGGGASLYEHVARRNCTISNADYVISGERGKVLRIDNTADYIRLAAISTAPYSTAIKTVSGWIRPGWSDAPGASNCLWCAIRDAGGTSWGIYIGDTLNLVGCWSGVTWRSVNYSFSINTWYHVCWQFTSELYVNGVSIGTIEGGAPTGGSHDFNIGGAAQWDVNETFIGDLSDLRLYNRLLSPADIWHQYANPWELYRPNVPYVLGIVAAGGTTYYSTPVGAITVAGAIARLTATPRAGAITPAGVVLKLTATPRAGAITPAGAVVKQTQTTRTGTLTMVGAVVAQAQKVLAGAFTSAGVVVGQAQKVLAGALTSAGAVVKRTSKPIAGTLTTAGTITRQVARTLSGAFTSAGAVAKQTVRSLAGAITLAGVVSTIKTVLKTLTGAITFSGALVGQAQKTLTGSLATAGTVIKRTSKTFAGTFTSAGVAAASLVGTAIITLTLAARSLALTVRTRSIALALKARSLALTLLER